LGVITESPISEAIEADEQVRRDEAAINAARAAVNSAKANYDSAVKAYNASLKQANISRGKAAEANAIAAPEYEILLGNIRAIGITDELYALPVAETALGAPRIVYDMTTLVDDEVHIVG
jgi:phage-related minor tail protein